MKRIVLLCFILVLPLLVGFNYSQAPGNEWGLMFQAPQKAPMTSTRHVKVGEDIVTATLDSGSPDLTWGEITATGRYARYGYHSFF